MNIQCKTLEEAVRNQLEEYVTEVASMYRYNPFHNFEHVRTQSKQSYGTFFFFRLRAKVSRIYFFNFFFQASHVTMSVTKLLSRIVAPDARRDGNGRHDPVGGRMRQADRDLSVEV